MGGWLGVVWVIVWTIVGLLAVWTCLALAFILVIGRAWKREVGPSKPVRRR